MTNILRQEINKIVIDNKTDWFKFKNSVVLVTGASGLIGSTIVRTLEFANSKYNLNLKIISHTRKEYGDIRNPLLIEKVDFIFHCAAITKSIDMVTNPVDVMSVAIDGTHNILDFAKKIKCKSIVFLSSMEVYGQTELNEVNENNLGYINLFNPRSSYSESKRCCETMCCAYYSQYNVPVKIARLAQTFGGGTPKTDTRVFAQFAKSAIEKKDIILHTEGKSRGNYCHISDAIRGLFIILLNGANGQAYNIANPDTSMTIKEMAELVAHNYRINVRIEMPENIEKLGYSPIMKHRLNIDKIRQLGWIPKYNLDKMYADLIDDWQEQD